MDKTGTLTVGKPEISLVVEFNDFKEEEILRVAACVEQDSEHPLANAVVKKSKRKKSSILTVPIILNILQEKVSQLKWIPKPLHWEI